MALRDVNYWYVLAVIFAILTLISALGEWVFRWWNNPGELFSAVGVVLTLLALGFGASRSQSRGMLAKQDVLLTKMDQMLAKQDLMLQKMDQLLEGQARQTRLLEELVASFRPAQSG